MPEQTSVMTALYMHGQAELIHCVNGNLGTGVIVNSSLILRECPRRPEVVVCRKGINTFEVIHFVLKTEVKGHNQSSKKA